MNGLFGVNGLLGYVVAVVLLLAIVFGLGYAAVSTQASVATNYYTLDAQSLKMNSSANAALYKDAK